MLLFHCLLLFLFDYRLARDCFLSRKSTLLKKESYSKYRKSYFPFQLFSSTLVANLLRQDRLRMKGLLAIICSQPLSFFDAKERTQWKPQVKRSSWVVGGWRGVERENGYFLFFLLHAHTSTRCTVVLSSSPPISRDQRS